MEKGKTDFYGNTENGFWCVSVGKIIFFVPWLMKEGNDEKIVEYTKKANGKNWKIEGKGQSQGMG